MTNYNFIEKFFCGRPINDAQVQLAEATANAALLQKSLDDTNKALETAKVQYQTCDANISATKAQLQSQISTLIAEKADLEIALAQAQKTIQNLSQNFDNTNTFLLLPASTQVVAQAYYDKYPEAFVTYNGRSWGVGKARYALDVKAFCLEGQIDQRIMAAVYECRGKISQVLQDMPSLSFHQACDVSIMRIKAKLDGMVTYQYDSQSWGETEYWMFASETIVAGVGDCEDKALLQFAAWRYAGIPNELIRLIAGMTFTNEGHASTTYFASDLKWHHVNSTTNYPASRDVKTLPVFGDSTEALNFQTIWFAATDKKTFHWFETAADKATVKTLKDDGFLKFIKFSKR